MNTITDSAAIYRNNEAVSSMLEYIIISSVLMLLMVILALTITNSVILPPINQYTEYAFIDIGNGVSTRIVDLYVIAPDNGNITTLYDIPDDIAGREYFVTIVTATTGDHVTVYRENIQRNVSLAGIGATLKAGGKTTGHGMNKITYRSEAFS